MASGASAFTTQSWLSWSSYAGARCVISTKDAEWKCHLVLHSCAICPALSLSIPVWWFNGVVRLGFYHLTAFSCPASSEFSVTVDLRLLATLQWWFDLVKVATWQLLLLRLGLFMVFSPKKESITSLMNSTKVNSFSCFYVNVEILFDVETDGLPPLSRIYREYLKTMGQVLLQDSKGGLLERKPSRLRYFPLSALLAQAWNILFEVQCLTVLLVVSKLAFWCTTI